jgi:hypothetical protein
VNHMRKRLHWMLFSLWGLSLLAGMTLFLAPASVARADAPTNSRSMWGGLKTWSNTTPRATSPSGATLVTVASGLNNPRHLRWAPGGALIIVEAGAGGELPVEMEGGIIVWYGASGSITRVDPETGEQERIAEGLPSIAEEEDGSLAIGAHDVAYLPAPVVQGVDGLPWDFYLLMGLGLGGTPENRARFPEEAILFGHLLRLDGVDWEPVADLLEFEAEQNPDGGEPDSNPFAMVVPDGMEGFLVADAGGNNLLMVLPSGEVTSLVVFPDRMVPAPPFPPFEPGDEIPMQAVPTSLAFGPEGDLYLGQLTGFPFPQGGANVYRITQNKGFSAEVYAEGLTTITDMVAGPDGSLYVLTLTDELLAPEPPPGYVTRIYPDGRRERVVDGLVTPMGMTMRDDGYLCISNFAVFPAIGEVICVEPGPTAVTVSSVSATPSGGTPLLGLALLALAAPLGAFLARRRLA